jgi:hypothetical protein
MKSKPSTPGRKERSTPELRALPIAEFCAVYHTSPATVWRGIAAGRIKTINLSGKPGGKRLVLLSSIEQERA